MSISTERLSSTSTAVRPLDDATPTAPAPSRDPLSRRLVRVASSSVGVASATAVIVGLAATAVHVALVREQADGARGADSVSLAAWSRALARAEAEMRIDPARPVRLRPVALRTVPDDIGVVARAATSPVVDMAHHAPRRLATRSTADAFNAALIADFLRAAPSHHRLHAVAHGRRPVRMALSVTQLDAEGVADLPAASGHGTSGRAGMALSVAGAPAQRSTPKAASGGWGFDSGIGRIDTDARAGTLNGQPAAAVDLGVTEDGVRFSAAGMSEVTSFDPATLRHAFKAMTGASIPLD